VFAYSNRFACMLILYYSQYTYFSHVRIIHTFVYKRTLLPILQRNSFLCFMLSHSKFVACNFCFHKYNYSSLFIWIISSQLYIFNPIIKTILFVIFCLLLEAWLILTLHPIILYLVSKFPLQMFLHFQIFKK